MMETSLVNTLNIGTLQWMTFGYEIRRLAVLNLFPSIAIGVYPDSFEGVELQTRVGSVALRTGEMSGQTQTPHPIWLSAMYGMYG